ncbi:MAG: RNA 3'-terminal phosphate cyclase, partial [bacterium]
MIEIDGSSGEGGGQILRTALGLSAALQKPFRIFNIRINRKKPGLMPQHLMAVRAMKIISGATVTGDSPGSMELMFRPARVKPGAYTFDIGTAGSTSLLLQALLPPLVFADESSSLVLKGGTHVPFSPPFHYISAVFLPVLNRLGIGLTAAIEHYGFYPQGGGSISVSISPQRNPRGLTMRERGVVREITGISGVGNLPLTIAERQARAAREIL